MASLLVRRMIAIKLFAFPFDSCFLMTKTKTSEFLQNSEAFLVEKLPLSQRIQRLPARKTGVDLVPVGDALLTVLPA